MTEAFSDRGRGKPGDYFVHSRTEMVDFVPGATRSMLDVGCGEGGFGAAVRAARPHVEVSGVEVNPDAVAVASTHYERVWHGGYPDALADDEAAFDCVVFNDVLEHMVDPWAALQATHRILRPGGAVVASIPNVRHAPVLYDLLVRGRWEYTTQGVLDRTHLRFFSKATTADLFASTGFSVDRIEGINPIRLNVRTARYLILPRPRDARFLQYAVVARPTR